MHRFGYPVAHIKPIIIVILPFLVLGLAPWSRSSAVTSRLAESHECMRAVQPELRTVLGSNPDMMGAREGGRQSERERGGGRGEYTCEVQINDIKI